MKNVVIIISVLLISCVEKEKPLTAQAIVDKVINVSCSGNCDHATIDFIFRGRQYISTREGNTYQLERITNDSLGVTHDVLSNESFKRYKNDILIKLEDSMSVRYSNSVNSVHYFVQLPYGLNAQAVKKVLLGEAIIKEETYYEIGVSFSEENGGTDFDDTFVYWIHKEKFTVDYLAYQYAVNGGGIRFREAYNVRVVNGIRFVDYNNFKPETLETPLTKLDDLFEADELKLLSKIEIESVGVKLIPHD